MLTPELAITGYPPQDLVFKSRFVPLNLENLDELHAAVGEAPLMVGFIDFNDGPGQPFHNAAAVLQRGQPIEKIFKSLLPTYDVFDEDRYFEPAASVRPLEFLETRFSASRFARTSGRTNICPRRLYEGDPVGCLVGHGAPRS